MERDDGASVQAGADRLSCASVARAQGELRALPDDSSPGMQYRRFRVPCAALPTDIAGSPPDRLEVDAVTSRGMPGGETRRGRDETGNRDHVTGNGEEQTWDGYRKSDVGRCQSPAGRRGLSSGPQSAEARARLIGWNTVAAALYG